MTNNTPDVAGLVRHLTDENLSVREFYITRDHDQQPLSARLMFGAAVESIPQNLPTHVISGEKEIPVTYQKFEKN